MNYIGNIIRPPSEADSIILQVTVGCSHNKCTFCGAYKDVSFSIKDREQVREDLAFAQKYCGLQNRVFLADGDVLTLPQARLVELFSMINKYLPWVNKISSYATARSIRSKSIADLCELKKRGLGRVYLGLESGSDNVLQTVCKGSTAEDMISAAEKLRSAQLFFSVTVLLGLGGEAMSTEHATATGKVLERMAPHQIAVLTLMVLENTPLWSEMESGNFTLPSPHTMLKELAQILEQLGNIRCQFHANHASSYLPLSGRLPKDKPALIQCINEALNGTIPITPEFHRRL